MTDNMTTKQRASLLLRRYDLLRRELRDTERDLAKACTTYGRECGVWGFNKDHLRIQLDSEERTRIEMLAEQNAWERAHG